MDFLYQYFLLPVMMDGWFNPVNSLVYGIVLIAGIWLVFNILKRVKIKVDKKLFFALIPFIAFAGVTRTLRDYIYFNSSDVAGFFASFSVHMGMMQQSAYDYILSVTGNQFLAAADSYIVAWFPTPGSYMITFLFALAALFVSFLIQKYFEIEYWKPMFAIGFALFLVNSLMLPFSSVMPLLYIGAVSLAWTGLFFSITFFAKSKKSQKLSKIAGKKITEPIKKMFTPMNSTILSAHLFDATATFFAIAMFSTMAGQGYTEQHFLSRGMMPFLGPGVMFLLKLVVVIPVLYFIDRYMEDDEFKGMLKLVVFILGLAPASRNLARLMVGV
jgi:uncharacterized membrane protein